jgi:hypothetical protein
MLGDEYGVMLDMEWIDADRWWVVVLLIGVVSISTLL